MRRLCAAIGLLLLTCSREPQRNSFILATTTTIQGSGVLPLLQNGFARDTGIEIHPIVSGSGRALQLAAHNDADVTMTHDPALERAFVAAQHPRLYRQLMWNDFVIVGPATDPADVVHARDAGDAFARIARARVRFASRNDQSGTNAKELALWKAAGIGPESNPGYTKMGQPMAPLLRASSEMQAYTLSDRATFEQLAGNLQLRILLAGDPVLRNVYSVMLISSNPNGSKFVDWLLRGHGHALLAAYQIKGKPAFHMM
jgi:tungstate transport system substrate-binding protein